MSRLLNVFGILSLLLVFTACENMPNYFQEPVGGGYSSYPPYAKPSEYDQDQAVTQAVLHGQRLPVYQGGQGNYQVEFVNKHKAQLFDVPGYPSTGDTCIPIYPEGRTPAHLPYPLDNYPLLVFDGTNFDQIQIGPDDMLTYGPMIIGAILGYY